MTLPPVTMYTALVLVGLAASAAIWTHLIRSGRAGDRRLVVVYLGALAGAALGAKLAFLLAEGWHYRGDMVALLTGRSITGGLIGGYVGVELAKRMVGYASSTGDLFAVVLPVALMLGRIGCLVEGCCPGVVCEQSWWTMAGEDGVHRWPAAAVELGFNVAFLVWLAAASRRGWAVNNRVHVYLVAYGVFRFAHEFVRDNQAIVGAVTGYHALAAGLVALGVWGHRRHRAEGGCGASSSG